MGEFMNVIIKSVIISLAIFGTCLAFTISPEQMATVIQVAKERPVAQVTTPIVTDEEVASSSLVSRNVRVRRHLLFPFRGSVTITKETYCNADGSLSCYRTVTRERPRIFSRGTVTRTVERPRLLWRVLLPRNWGCRCR